MNCVYCNKEIISEKRKDEDKDYSKVYLSSEHIIQNSLGGRLESKEICCDRCNFHIEELIDKEFCKIFAPIIASIDNLKKTNKNNSKPKYSGYALDEENALVFADVIKQSKVVNSKEILDKEKGKGTKDLDKRLKNSYKNCKVVFSDFNLDNYYFKQGISKIAFNYAIYLGINPIEISDAYDIKLSGKNKELSSIKFKGKVIPFVAGNKLDEFIELNSDFKLFHNLILFEYSNQLWCYVNLFNTFQYYVLLSEDFKSGKDSLCYIYGSDFHYVESGMSSSDRYEDIILDQINKYTLLNNEYDKASYDFYLYNKKFNPLFRIINPLRKVNDTEYEQIFYPYWIAQSKEKVSVYCTEKFKRLNEYLKQNKVLISIEELKGMSKKDREKFLELKKKSVKPNILRVFI